MTTAQILTHAERAQQEYEKLKEFVTRLKDSVDVPELEALVKSFQDVSDAYFNKATELIDKYIDEQNRLQKMIESSLGGIILVDADLRISIITKTALTLLEVQKVRPDSWRGRMLPDMVDKEHQDAQTVIEEICETDPPNERRDGEVEINGSRIDWMSLPVFANWQLIVLRSVSKDNLLSKLSQLVPKDMFKQLNSERLDQFFTSLSVAIYEFDLEEFSGFSEDFARGNAERMLELFKRKLLDLDTQISYDYAYVLSHLRNHALLLGNLIGVYQNNIFIPSHRERFEKVLTLISKRLKVQGKPGVSPVLLPVISSSFKYFHFRYVDGFGLIGIPPELTSQSELNTNQLQALWHEVAGHAMALYQENDELETWAGELQTRLKSVKKWDQYSRMYRKNFKEYLSNQDEITPGSLELPDPLTLKFLLNRRKVFTNVKWQIVWLSEFLEDLFGYMVVKTLNKDLQRESLKSLFEALSQYSPDPEISDPYHPPAYLRLFVVMAYLSDNDDSTIEDLNRDLWLPTDCQELAKAIAEFCTEQLLDKVFVQVESDSEEKKFTTSILSKQTDWTTIDSQEKEDNSQKITLNKQFTDEIEKVFSISKLLKVRFNYDDPQQDGGYPSDVYLSSNDDEAQQDTEKSRLGGEIEGA